MSKFTPLQLIGIATLLACSSGCEIGRTWGAMSSDSPAPFLGIDLLPRRRTTQITPPEADDHPPTYRRFNEVTRPTISPVADRRARNWRTVELDLPGIRDVFTGEETEELSLTGPASAFSQ